MIQDKIKTSKKNNGEFKERMSVDVPKETKNEVNHFNQIWKYLTEKRHSIYVKAQSPDFNIRKEGIEQWDKMEILLEKVSANRDNKEYLNQLYDKILQLKAKEKDMSRQ